ncbi:hypothetical protein PIB30_095794 [Stylosanthes scabra]|uniref:Uncharacterized protein n=1 Tax=Stylosanthes scabra TaxID=79078 RepID=A0ABU6UYB1_9FABA|nr:hypothetical protein [Stylosanthes scabra]
MELLTEMETANVDAAGPSSSSGGGPGAIIAAPIRTATPERSDDDSDEDFVGNSDESSESSDGSEFVRNLRRGRVFCFLHQARYLICHPVVESGPDKYVCRCKRYDAGCPRLLRVALRTNLGYWYVEGAEVWWTARLFGTVNVLRSRSVRRQTDLQLHLADNKGQSCCAHFGVAICPSTELLLHAVLHEGLDGEAEGNR